MRVVLVRARLLRARWRPMPERVDGMLGFRVPRVPPLRQLSPLLARAGSGALRRSGSAVGGTRAGAPRGQHRRGLLLMRRRARAALPLNAEARVTHAVRTIDRYPRAALSLAAVGARSQPEPVSFSSHVPARDRHHAASYVLRARLRDAATRLVGEPDKVLDVALDSGFGDVSNFNRAFRAEFGVSPRGFRQPRR